MSEELTNLIDVTENIKYVYVAIPKEYVCVYHRILIMLADFGVDMLEDCKASCTSKSTSIIECFNTFNAAVAAYKLNQLSLANTLINYVKTKINQIYRGDDNSPSFTFPVDENGEINAVVSCDDDVRLYIDPESGELFSRIFRTDGGIQQQFMLGIEDEPEYPIQEHQQKPFDYDLTLSWNEIEDNEDQMLLDVTISNVVDVDDNSINAVDCDYSFTLNGIYYNKQPNTSTFTINKYSGTRTLNFVVYYNNRGIIHTLPLQWGVNNE